MMRFSPNNRPPFSTNNFEVPKQNVGTILSPSQMKHPSLAGYQTPLKIVGCKAYDGEGKLVGTFEDGVFKPLEH
jgi:hypothetical protein